MNDLRILETRIDNPVNIKPVHGFILIQKLDDEDQIIFIPEGVKDPLQQWAVLAISDETTCVKVGDRILIIPDARIVKVCNDRRIGMMHDNGVVGIVS